MYSKCNLKMPSALQCAWQRCAAVTLCMVCSLIFMSSGCGNKSLVNDADDENESPYYCYQYQGMDANPLYKKTYIRLNAKYISLSLKEPQLPADIAQRGFTVAEFQCDYFDNWKYKGKPGTRRYWTELNIGKVLTPEQYFELLADIKQKNSDVIVGPFFNSLDPPEGAKGFGTGHFFSVKLKSKEDEALLEQMAEQTGLDILHDGYDRSLWYRMVITEESELNALECANIFYESGLFDSVEMVFMNNPEIEFDSFEGEEFLFTEYLLDAISGQWTNLFPESGDSPYDNRVIIINSNDELKQYYAGDDGVYIDIDFSKHTLLLASGITPNVISKKNVKGLRIISTSKYKLYVGIVLTDFCALDKWTFALITNKLSDQTKIDVDVISNKGKL